MSPKKRKKKQKIVTYTESLWWLKMPTVWRPLEHSRSTCPEDKKIFSLRFMYI